LAVFAFILVFWINQLAAASTHWAATEFEQLDLGDARLNKRARILMERFAADRWRAFRRPAFGWSETVAAYRLFDNDRVDWRTLMGPHWQQTALLGDSSAGKATVNPASRPSGLA